MTQHHMPVMLYICMYIYILGCKPVSSLLFMWLYSRTLLHLLSKRNLHYHIHIHFNINFRLKKCWMLAFRHIYLYHGLLYLCCLYYELYWHCIINDLIYISQSFRLQLSFPTAICPVSFALYFKFQFSYIFVQ